MKLCIVADIHIESGALYGYIDSSTGLNARIIDFLKSFDFVINYVLENNIDVLVVAGDIYKSRNPRQRIQKEFAKRIKYLVDNKKGVVLLQGNHDIIISDDTHTNAVLQIFAPDNLYIIDKPTCIKFDDCVICGIPYVSKSILSVNSHDEVIKLYFQYIEDICERLKNDKKKNTICIAHQIVQDSLYVPSQDITYLKDTILPKELFLKFDITFLGHIHNYQVLNEKPDIIMVGSLDKIDFNDEFVDKGFIVYDTLERKYQFIKNNNARQMVTIKIKGDSDKKILSELQEKLKDKKESIVRVELEGNKINELTLGKVKKMLYESVWFAGDIKVISTQKTKERSGKINEEMSYTDALAEYLKHIITDKDYRESIYNLGINIIEEVNKEIV